MNLHDSVLELRKKYCEECIQRYTSEEIDNGAKCPICKKCEKLGKTVANLQD